jgi:nitrogen-specific signal transduction histidine kinase
VDPDTPPVLADGDRLRQVLINLTDNAISTLHPRPAGT